MARFWHVVFLACLPMAVLLAAGGQWLPAGVVLVLGASLFWRMRNVAGGSSLRERALERDGGQTEGTDRMVVADTPLPATHPIVSRYGRPGELIYPGLGVIDRDAYLMTERKRRQRRRMWEATRTVFLTTQRLLIVDEAMGHQTSLSLRDIYDVNLVPPPESRPALSGEMTIKVAFGADKKRRLVHWDARAADAELFARMLQEAVAKNEGLQTTSALLAPGATLPIISVERVRQAIVELKPEGMAFARTLIPWDEMADVRRGEGEDSLLFVGYVLSVEVPDLGSAIDPWVSYIEAHGVSVTVFSRKPTE